MKKVTDILMELSGTNSKNEKEKILKLHADNPVLQKTFSVAYSKELNFFVRNFKADLDISGGTPISDSIDLLVENVAGRVYTGLEAKAYISKLVNSCEEPDTLLKVINRDLECGVQASSANKVWKNLITEPPYQSYTLFKEDLLRKFNYEGAFSDEKMDGLYTDVMVWPEQVVLRSRSGKELNFKAPVEVENKLKSFAKENSPFVAHGEGLVIDDNSPNGFMERAEGNGYLNQDPAEIDRDIVALVVWDMVSMDDYLSRKSTKEYKHRREEIKNLVTYVGMEKSFRLVSGRRINSLKEAIEHFVEMRHLKKEGTVLKEAAMLWGDNKTKKGLKLKNMFDVDLLVVGTSPHKKDPSLVGALTCQTRDDLLEVGVGSGLTDALRKKPSEYFMGQIITIKANDITKSDTKNVQSLFLPRLNYKFVEVRTDKNTANSLEEVVEASDSLLELLRAIAEEI